MSSETDHSSIDIPDEFLTQLSSFINDNDINDYHNDNNDCNDNCINNSCNEMTTVTKTTSTTSTATMTTVTTPTKIVNEKPIHSFDNIQTYFQINLFARVNFKKVFARPKDGQFVRIVLGRQTRKDYSRIPSSFIILLFLS